MADAAKFDKNMASARGDGEGCVWLDVPHAPIQVRGLGFFEAENSWNRLPEALLPVLRDKRPALVELARHTAGASLDFVTDSPEVWVRAQVDAPPYMSHMTAAAQCGCDCYVRVPGGDWAFAGVTKFPVADRSFCCRLAEHLVPHTQVRIHLPLYIGVQSVEVGLAPGAQLQPPPAFSRRGVAFYGTSITQGGCASHPGMAYPALLSRMLDAPCYNLGFSGNGVGMPDLAGAICALPDLGRWWWTLSPMPRPKDCWNRICPAFWTRCGLMRRSCRCWCCPQPHVRPRSGTAPLPPKRKRMPLFSTRRWKSAVPRETGRSSLRTAGPCWGRRARKPPWTEAT